MPLHSAVAGQLQHQYGDKLAVVALAVESPEDQIRSTVKSLSPDLHWAIADAPTAAAFGDITSVPTLFLFDPRAKPRKSFTAPHPTCTPKPKRSWPRCCSRSQMCGAGTPARLLTRGPALVSRVLAARVGI